MEAIYLFYAIFHLILKIVFCETNIALRHQECTIAIATACIHPHPFDGFLIFLYSSPVVRRIWLKIDFLYTLM